MEYRNAAEAVAESLRAAVATGALTEQVAASVASVVTPSVSAWTASTADRLLRMAQEWEAVHGEDGTLYSLGLRRAADAVTGSSALESLPILERPDTPDEAE